MGSLLIHAATASTDLLYKGWLTCSRLPIRIWPPINSLSFIKTEYFLLLFRFKTCTAYTDAEIPHPGNQLSFMLHELVFRGCHSQFSSYSYSCKFFCGYGTDAFRCGIIFHWWTQSWKITINNKLSTFASAGFGCRIHVNQGWFTCSRLPIRIRHPFNVLIFIKNIICLVIILILKHVLRRLMQKYLNPIINCL